MAVRGKTNMVNMEKDKRLVPAQDVSYALILWYVSKIIYSWTLNHPKPLIS